MSENVAMCWVGAGIVAFCGLATAGSMAVAAVVVLVWTFIGVIIHYAMETRKK